MHREEREWLIALAVAIVSYASFLAGLFFHGIAP